MPGVRIMQLTQYITILGGGAGYFLAGTLHFYSSKQVFHQLNCLPLANSYVAELIPPEERTAAFGVLQGVAMLGTATGELALSLFVQLTSTDTSGIRLHPRWPRR